MTLPVCFWHTRVYRRLLAAAFAVACATWPLAATGQSTQILGPIFAPQPAQTNTYRQPYQTQYQPYYEPQNEPFYQPPLYQPPLYQPIVTPQVVQFSPPPPVPSGLFPRVTTPYRLIAPPFVDFSATGTHNDFGNDGSYQARFTGDFLYMSADLFLEGSDGSGFSFFDIFGGGSRPDLISDARITLGRQDPRRRVFSEIPLIGRLGISEITFGDIFTPSIPMLTSEVEGRGFIVSSFPLDSGLDFDTRTLRGVLPQGWTVELFRNGVVLGTRDSRGDGRYEFLDVPLLLEDNNFRLEFFGPQGQRRTEELTVPGLPNFLLSGKNFFRVAYNQENVRVFPFADTRQVGPARLVVEYERMINRFLTVKGNVTSIELSDDERHLTYGIGLRGTMGDTSLEITHVDDRQSGRGMQGTFRTDIFGLDLSVEHGRYFQLESETLGVENNFFIPVLERVTTLRVNGSLPTFGMIPEISYSAMHKFDRADDGSVGTETNFNTSTAIGDLFLSHGLSAFGFNDPFFGPSQTSINGNLFATSSLPLGPGITESFLSDIRLSGSLSYNLQPVRKLSFVDITAETLLFENWAAEIQVGRSFSPAGATTWSPSVSRNFGMFAFSANAEVIDENDEQDITIGLGLSFGAARDPRSGKIVSEPGNVASGGAVSIRVFVDNNTNGRFDAGEPTLPGIGFDPSFSFQLANASTDAQGTAFITNLPTFQELVIALDPRTFTDTSLQPAAQGVRIVPRPGVVTLVDLPFSPARGFTPSDPATPNQIEPEQFENVRFAPGGTYDPGIEFFPIVPSTVGRSAVTPAFPVPEIVNFELSQQTRPQVLCQFPCQPARTRNGFLLSAP